MVSLFSTYLKRVKLVDLLLPAGAALVSAGLQNLADREERQRRRLAELAVQIDRHHEALAAAGIELRDEFLQNETSPLDNVGPFMTLAGAYPAPEPDPEPRPRRRGWKVAAAALAGAVGVTLYARRGDLLDLVLARAGVDVTTPVDERGPQDAEPDPDGMSKPVRHPFVEVDGSVECEWCGRPRALHEPRPDPEPVDEPLPTEPPAPLESCGWPSCDWQSDENRSELSQRTAAAVHRNRCTYRPAGAVVPG